MFSVRLIRDAWHTMRFLSRDGPDLPRRLSRRLSLEEKASEALRNWMQEGTYLLPRRYQMILRQLLDENLISSEIYNACMEESRIIMWRGGSIILRVAVCTEHGISLVESLGFPWEGNEKLFSRASGPLQKKIQSFKVDWERFTTSTEGGFLAANIVARKDRV